MQTRDEVEGLHNRREFSQPLECYLTSGYANTGKKFSIAFIKYFSKLIRQMERNLFINLLIRKRFLNTRYRQSYFLLTNQNAHLIAHEPMKIRDTKIKSKFNFVEIASEQASGVLMKAISALNPSKSLGEMPKVQ